MSILSPEISKRLLSPQTRESEISRVRKALQNSAKLSQQQLIEAWAITAEYYKYKTKTEACIQAYLKCIEIVLSMSDTYLLSECYSDLGDALYYFKDYIGARGYYQKALDVIPSSGKEEVLLVHLLSQLAYCCRDTKSWDDERMYLMQALSLSVPILIKGTLLERLALSFNDSKQYDKAAETYEQALSVFDGEGFKREWKQRIEMLAGIYDALGDREAANKTRNRT